MIKMTHYFYVLSSWSLVAEDAIGEVRKRFADDLSYEWKVAVTDYGGDGPMRREDLTFYYGRLAAATGKHMNAGWWYEGYDWYVPDRVVTAARRLGAAGNEVRLALATAALQNGVPITRPDIALAIAAEAGGLDRERLAAETASPLTTLQLLEWSRRFEQSGVKLRPALHLENDLGDVVQLSGIWNVEPMLAAVQSLLTDEQTYYRYLEDHPRPST